MEETKKWTASVTVSLGKGPAIPANVSMTFTCATCIIKQHVVHLLRLDHGVELVSNELPDDVVTRAQEFRNTWDDPQYQNAKIDSFIGDVVRELARFLGVAGIRIDCLDPHELTIGSLEN